MGAPPRRFAPARRAPGPGEAKRAVRWKGRRMTAPAATAPTPDRGWFGHPRGLSTLFFTEMWERFSYYGMRGFLILYMTKALGFTDQHAGLAYGNYVFSVWFTPILGGLIADRWLGHYRSVLIGGAIIAPRPFTVALPGLPVFFPRPDVLALGAG